MTDPKANVLTPDRVDCDLQIEVLYPHGIPIRFSAYMMAHDGEWSGFSPTGAILTTKPSSDIVTIEVGGVLNAGRITSCVSRPSLIGARHD